MYKGRAYPGECERGHLNLYRLVARQIVDTPRRHQVVEVFATQDLEEHRHRVGVLEGLAVGGELSICPVEIEVQVDENVGFGL